MMFTRVVGEWSQLGKQPTQGKPGGSGAEMTEEAVEEVLAHAEDEDEWEEQPTRIESRPTGTQVISARLPTALAEKLLAEAARRGLKPSELVRAAVERMLHAEAGLAAFTMSNDVRVRVLTPVSPSRTENPNLVLTDEPSKVVALGFERPAASGE
jgi:hypothetical protein